MLSTFALCWLFLALNAVKKQQVQFIFKPATLIYYEEFSGMPRSY